MAVFRQPRRMFECPADRRAINPPAAGPAMSATTPQRTPIAMPMQCPDGFEPVHPVVLVRLGLWDMDLFLAGANGGKPVLLRGSGVEVDGQRIDALVESLETPVLVRSSDYQKLSEHLLDSLDGVVEDESIPSADRFVMVQTAAFAEVELASTLIDPERFVGASRRVGGVLVKLLQCGDMTPAEMFAVARHDHYTFTHVTNVCCYALQLATELGVTDPDELHELAVGALLHDSGKRRIPPSLVRKPGRLTKSELAIVRMHPQHGFEDLARGASLTLRQLMMVYQHHERVDGAGYPVGLTGGEIHSWARLLAVVDVFDALTGRRPYRRPCSSEVALRHLKAHAGSHFDKEMVRCWSKIIAAE